MLSRLSVLLVCAVVCVAQTKEDLGVVVQSADLGGSNVTRMGGDDVHYFGLFDSATGGLNLQIFDVNITTGVSRVVDTGKAGRGSSGVVSSHDHNLYFNAGDPCYFYRYVPATGVVTQLSDESWSEVACGEHASDKVIQTRTEGASGKLFFGTAVRGTVFQYDTNTGTFTDYGVISAPAGNPTCTSPACYRYVYTLEADANYVYAGMRDASTNDWWLTIITIADGTQTDCFKASPATDGGVKRKSSDNSLVYLHGTTWYTMPTDGTCPVSTISAQTVYPYYYIVGAQGTNHAVLTTYGMGDSDIYFDVDVDLTDINVDTSTAGVATIKYRTPAGSGEYSTATGTLTMRDAAIKLAKQAGSSDDLFVVGGSYKPNVLRSIATNETDTIGTTTQSTYGLAWDATSAAWYMAGYSSTFYRYTSANAWTVTPGNTITACSSGTPTNPCSANGSNLKYPYYVFVGSDGLIYSVDYDERSGATGGGIKWYNPTTHAVGAYRAGPPSLECFTPHGAALLDSGATIAYSGNAKTDVGAGCAETEGKIFLFDVATKAITDTLTPIEDAADPGTLTALPNGHLMGVVNDYPTSADYTIYSIDPATDTVDWSITGEATVGSGTTGAPAVGPDGYVYLYIGNNLTRLHPLTGATETAYADSTAHGGMSLVTGPFGSAMYLWGSTHLYRINLWRPAALRVKNSQSTATQIKLLYGRTTTLDATSQTVACAYNADCYVAIPGHVIGDMYYQWQFLTAGGAVTAASDITKVTIN